MGQDWPSLIAVKNGADAVYFGVKGLYEGIGTNSSNSDLKSDGVFARKILVKEKFLVT